MAYSQQHGWEDEPESVTWPGAYKLLAVTLLLLTLVIAILPLPNYVRSIHLGAVVMSAVSLPVLHIRDNQDPGGSALTSFLLYWLMLGGNLILLAVSKMAEM